MKNFLRSFRFQNHPEKSRPDGSSERKVAEILRPILLVAGLVACLIPANSSAANLQVSNANDAGAGSLRQAIIDFSAPGVIDFAPGVFTASSHTITLSSELVVSKAITIDASGLPKGVTLNGGGTTRLISVTGAGNLTLKRLTLNAGNSAGAIASGFGGAIYNAGQLKLENSMFTGSSSVNYGGAVSSIGSLEVIGCTVSGNTAGSLGGGIYSASSGNLIITNTTITGNTAFFGGGVYHTSPLTLNHATITANRAGNKGGGVYNDFSSALNLRSSIVAGNKAPESANFFGPFTVSATNLTSGDPKLAPLGDYGGPTLTMPPLPDSAAIDHAANEGLPTDQRGYPRVLGTKPDIGAYESPVSDYDRTGVTIYSRVTANEAGVFEISTDPDFSPTVSTFAGKVTAGTSTAGFKDGARLSAELGYPSGVAQDTLGNTFFADTGNHRIRMVGLDGNVVTIAGTGVYGLANGPGPVAAFAFPSALAVGPDGNVYVADTYNHRICKLTRPAIPGGVWTVTNLAGTGIAGFVEGAGSVARFKFPYGLTLDASGNVFVADSYNHRIRKVTPAGAVSTYAGSGTVGFLDSASASSARFDTPQGVVISGGNLYVADTFNNRIRKVLAVGSTAGAVSTFAGSTQGMKDGNDTSAQFNNPSGIAEDGKGSLYIADEQNHRIRRITAAGEVTTVAGTDGTDGKRFADGKYTVAQFNSPTGVAVGIDGNLLVADAANHLLRRIVIKPLSVPSTAVLDGYGVQVKSVLDVNALGLDPGVTYYFRWKSTAIPITQTLVESFYLYDFPTVVTVAVDDTKSSPTSAVMNAKVDPKNSRTAVSFEFSTDPDLLKPYEVKTLAGSGVAGFRDATGLTAQFSNPSGVVSDADGNVFVADRQNHRIRKITEGGVVTTFAGSGVGGFQDGTGAVAKFERPTGLAIDSSGNLYVADEANHVIRKITEYGVVSTFAGSGIAGFAEGAALSAKFLYPTGVAVANDGTVYVADSGNQRIRKITGGVVSTLAGTGVAGSTDGAVEIAQFSSPQGLAIDSGGGVVVADTGNHRIRVISAGNVTTFAGSGAEGFVDGLGAAARFSSPRGVAVDSSGVVFVTDSGNHRIRKIFPNGEVSTLAGSGIAGQLDSPAVGLFPVTACQFDFPQGIFVNSSGALFVTQQGLLRKIARSATLPTVTLNPDAEGAGVLALSAAVNQPLLYGTTYYFQVRGTSYRDSITGGILSFVTPRADISVFAGANTSAPVLTHLQSAVVDFGSTPTGQPFTRSFTISNPGTSPLTISSVNLPAGFQLTGPIGVIDPLASAAFQITVSAATAGNYSGNVVISNDAPEKTVFSFPIAGVVLDPPLLTTLPATSVAKGSATFNATVNPRDSATTVWFEWSQDAEFDGLSVSTLAGSTSGYQEGTGTAAQFNQPSGIVTDAGGNTYIADKQNHRIRKIAADGRTSTFAGTGVAGFADGAGATARFDQPTGLAINASGVLFVADSNNHRIRAIDSSGVVSTHSGLGTAGFTDGIATAARFSSPAGLAIDHLGVLYVADSGNHRIRKVASDGSVTTLAGTGVAGSADGAAATFNGPLGIARDSVGFVYVTETGGDAVRKIAPDGSTSVFAGDVSNSGFVDATGTSARFSDPSGLAVGVGGVLYVADKGNHRIRKISGAGVVGTLAGSGTSGTLDGPGEVARFFSPISLGTTAGGGVVVGEAGSSAVRKITSLQVLLEAATGLTGTSNIPVELAVTGLPASGPYYFRSIATNGGGTVIANHLPVFWGYAGWQVAKFGPDASNPLIAGATACPSGDGMSNLLKYAFGLDPLVAAADAAPDMALSSGILTLTYTQVLAATDLVYTVEWSPDLSAWNTEGVTEKVVSSDAATQQILATAPAQARFLRVHITLP